MSAGSTYPILWTSHLSIFSAHRVLELNERLYGDKRLLDLLDRLFFPVQPCIEDFITALLLPIMYLKRYDCCAPDWSKRTIPLPAR
jgi:hypothetical protein